MATIATLTDKILQGNKAAWAEVKTLLSTPVLINPGFGYYENQTRHPFAIPLETESHTQSMSAEVSESLVICKDQKKNMADNIAPGSWSWSLSGYIPGSSLLEPTNLYTPIVKLQTDLLKMAMEKGYMLIFKDIDNTIYRRVVIQSLDIETQADCKNKTPFSMTLKQINSMDDIEFTGEGSNIASLLSQGSRLGQKITAGVTMGTNLIMGSTALGSIL